jgi:hypothetical protein
MSVDACKQPSGGKRHGRSAEAELRRGKPRRSLDQNALHHEHSIRVVTEMTRRRRINIKL